METVYRASSIEQGDIVVAWLAEQGVTAFVKNRNMAGNYATFAVAPRGIEVCVVEPSQVTQAKSLLAEHDILTKQNHRLRDKKVTTICPECGRQIEFPGELYGTVQTCPACRQNVDVLEPPQYC